MKFGIFNTALTTEPGNLAAVAQHAEDCGFESFYVGEHIALYPGAKHPDAAEFPADLAIPDPLACLTFIAAKTERILLGTGVLLLPYRHPVVLAKQLATIDVLSAGRMRLLTVGLGVLPGEAHAFGVEFAARGRRADEAIDVLRLLWAGGKEGVSFTGEHFCFQNLCSFPKPWRTSTLPVHVGGASRAAARRAGLRGDGYFSGGLLTAAERAAQLDVMRTVAAEAGRDPGALEYTRWGSIDMTPDDVQAQAGNGVARLIVGSASTDPREQREQITAFARRHRLG